MTRKQRNKLAVIIHALEALKDETEDAKARNLLAEAIQSCVLVQAMFAD